MVTEIVYQISMLVVYCEKRKKNKFTEMSGKEPVTLVTHGLDTLNVKMILIGSNTVLGWRERQRGRLGKHGGMRI